MEKISVVGSCICRDLFNFDYHSKYSFFTDVRFTSPYTMNTEPLPVQNQIDFSDFVNQEIHYSSNWFQKNLKNDLNKILYQSLLEKHGDWLILDIADARIPICELTFESCPEKKYYVSSSAPFNLNYEANFIKNKLKNTKRQNIDPKTIPLNTWLDMIEKHIENLTKIFPSNKIILLENYCVKEFIDKNGCLHCFDSSFSSMIQTSDKLFQPLYEKIERLLPDCHIIKIPPKAVSNCNNRWGQHPLHMDQTYYQYLLKCVDAITTGQDNLITDLYNEYTYVFENIYSLAEYKTAIANKYNNNNIEILSLFREHYLDANKGISLLVVAKFCHYLEKNLNLRYFHYGINNIVINQFMKNHLRSDYSSIWLHPEALDKYENYVLLIDSLKMGKGISEEALVNKLSKLKENQFVIILNSDLNDKMDILGTMVHNLSYTYRDEAKTIKILFNQKNKFISYDEDFCLLDCDTNVKIHLEA